MGMKVEGGPSLFAWLPICGSCKLKSQVHCGERPLRFGRGQRFKAGLFQRPKFRALYRAFSKASVNKGLDDFPN